MPKFGPESTKDYLHLFSSDLVLDIGNKDIGIDLLRRICGEFFYYSTDEGFKCIDNTTTSFESVENLAGHPVTRAESPNCEQIQYVEVNPTRIQTIDENVDIVNLKIPFRLYADKDNKSVKGDFHWKQFLFGGEYMGQSLPKRLNSEKIFYDASFILPAFIDYTKQAAYNETIGGIPIATSKCNIFSNYYDYNQSVQKYQDWAHDLETELLIPNYYVISDYYEDRSETLDIVPTTAEVVGAQIGYIKNKQDTINYHFPNGSYFNELEKDEYFGTFFTETGKKLKYAQTAARSQQNIILDQHYFDYIKDQIIPESDEFPYRLKYVDEKLSTFFNIEIKFDRHVNSYYSKPPPFIDGSLPGIEASEVGDFIRDYEYTSLSNSTPKASKQLIRQQIQNNNFSSRLLEILKDIDEGAITEIPRKKLPFNFLVSKDTFSHTGEGIIPAPPITERPEQKIGLRSLNFMDLLTYVYNNYDVALNDNYIFAGPSSNNAHRAATMSDDTFNRTLNSQSLIDLMDSVKDLTNRYLTDLNPLELTERRSYESVTSLSADIIQHLYGANFKNNEVLAYKIEKIAGPATGDLSAQNVIQKYWVFNSIGAPKEVSLYDSQVKYGKEYTYRVTAYALVTTHKYKYGDFRLTKQIGAADYIGEDGSVEYCLQFYNPENNVISPQLFAQAELSLSEDDPRRTVLSGLNDIAPSSAEISRHPQLADFHLYIEPCMELIEIPMFEKSIKVMDSPCNSINVTPFHFIDNSGRVGFQINQESFIKRPYPELISQEDQSERGDYYKSKELVPYNLVTLFSESPARYIQLYRIKQKPNSFADFNDSLVATIDLRIDKEAYNFSNKIISDQIKSNTVYYYVLRFVNENGVSGPLSQIIQCELVDDGGYTYALFDTIDSSEFNPNQITTSTVSFKKLIQIDPNIEHLYFDDQAVNYDDFAMNQIDNLVVGLKEKNIWDKKFKIRLTSKKTSKKLDLNVTYNKIHRDLSKFSGSPVSPPDDYTPDELPTSSDLESSTVEVIESGILDLSAVKDSTAFGIADVVLEPDIDIDYVVGAETTATAVIDEIVTSKEILKRFEDFGIVTQGVGFPLSVYNFISSASAEFGFGGYSWLKSALAVSSVWDPAGASFTSGYHTGAFTEQLASWVYSNRNNSAMLVPLDRTMALLSAYLILMYIPKAATDVHPSSTPATVRYWQPGGRWFNIYASQLYDLFATMEPYNKFDNYGDLAGSPSLSPDFNVNILLENLGLSPGLFTARPGEAISYFESL